MGFNKEKEKLQQLLERIKTAANPDEANTQLLHECYQEYAKVIAVLYRKQPNVFGNCYNYDRVEIRGNKKFLKESFSDKARESNFLIYRDSLINAIERVITYITDFL